MKLNSSKILATFSAAILFALAQNASAALTCTAEWETSETTPHCHVTISQTGQSESTFVCTGGMNLEDVSTQEKCESLCGAEGGVLQPKLEQLMFSSIRQWKNKVAEISMELVMAKLELAQLAQLAKVACVKADMFDTLMGRIEALSQQTSSTDSLSKSQ